MNTLWHHEINVWDWIYRALEIKKHAQSIKTGTTKLKFDEERQKIEEESAPLEDSDYEALLETWKEAEDEKNEKNEDNIITKLVDTFKGSIMPKRNKEIKDSNLLNLIGNTSKQSNHIKIIGRKSQKPKSEVAKEDPLSMIKRNIDKNLKRTINAKVADSIQNWEELNSIDKPKESLYQKIAHKIYEAQEDHKLYNGDTMTTVSIKGKQMKQVNNDGKILILYISNLLLFAKKTDAIKAIDQYGRYFYDKNLWEANLRKLKGLALIDSKSDIKSNREAVAEFLKAKVIFEQYKSDLGQAICWAAIGYLIYELAQKFQTNRKELFNYAKKKFIESLTFYEKLEHKYGMSYWYDMLHDIKRNLGENGDKEYINHVNLLKMIKLDIDSEKLKFKERIQGAEVSLFIENILTIDKIESKPSCDFSDPNAMVHHVIEKKQLMEKLYEKMTQRIDALNNMLANHSLIQSVKPNQRVLSIPAQSSGLNTITVPSVQESSKLGGGFKMFDNSQIKQSNVNFKQFHFVNNFYGKTSERYDIKGKSPKLKRPSPIKARKMFANSKQSSVSSGLGSNWAPSIFRQRNDANFVTTDKRALENSEYTPQPSAKFKMKRKESEGTKTSMLIMDDSDIERDLDTSNVRLYYDDGPQEFNLKNLAQARMIKNYDNTPTPSTFKNLESIELDPLPSEPQKTVQKNKKSSRVKKKRKVFPSQQSAFKIVEIYDN